MAKNKLRGEKTGPFPNPSTSMLNINLSNEGQGIQTVRGVNLLGEEIVKERYPFQTSISINSSNWSSGHYIVIINAYWIEKMVVE